MEKKLGGSEGPPAFAGRLGTANRDTAAGLGAAGFAAAGLGAANRDTAAGLGAAGFAAAGLGAA